MYISSEFKCSKNTFLSKIKCVFKYIFFKKKLNEYIGNSIYNIYFSYPSIWLYSNKSVKKNKSSDVFNLITFNWINECTEVFIEGSNVKDFNPFIILWK